MNIDAPPAAIAEMERNMRLHEDVLRYLTVKVEELSDEPSAILRSREERGGRGGRGRRDDRPRRDGPPPRRDEAPAPAPASNADAPTETAAADSGDKACEGDKQ